MRACAGRLPDVFSPKEAATDTVAASQLSFTTVIVVTLFLAQSNQPIIHKIYPTVVRQCRERKRQEKTEARLGLNVSGVLGYRGVCSSRLVAVIFQSDDGACTQ